MDTPQVDDFLLWIGAMATAFVAISGSMVVLKKWLLSDLRKDLDDVRAQLHRNSGTSLRDAVDRIEERQGLIAVDVRRVTERLDDHIAFHLEDK
jgi:hypothetical protein